MRNLCLRIRDNFAVCILHLLISDSEQRVVVHSEHSLKKKGG